MIITREFLITGLRQLAAGQGVILPADPLGKHKTAWQLITILFFLVLLAAGDFFGDDSHWLRFLGKTSGPILIGITIILTIYSGLAYLWKNRKLLSRRCHTSPEAALRPISSISPSSGPLPPDRKESSSFGTRIMRPFFQTSDSGKQGPTFNGSLQK